MNQDQAKAWLPLIQAVADGKTLQTKMKCKQNPYGKWSDLSLSYGFSLKDVIYCERDVNDFRIKPEPKKARYRVALLKDGGGYWAKTINHEGYNFSDDKDVTFVHWLTDFIEYELPEGEA